MAVRRRVAWLVPVLPFAGALLIAGSGGLLVSMPLPFAQRLIAACLAVFLVDALGGRWFGYAALAIPFVGLFADPGGTWAGMLPLIVGSLLSALVLRHAEPGWLGVPLALGGFVLPLAAILVVRARLDPSLELPLGGRYPQLHALAGGFAILVSTVVAMPRRAAARRRQAQARGRARRGP